MTAHRLLVLLYGEVVGVIDRARPSDPPSFTYEPTYVESGSVPLGLRMPVTERRHRGKVVEVYLQGILPEDRTTRQRWADRLHADPDDPVALLAGMGWDCPGSVQFCIPDELGDLLARDGEHVEVSEAEIATRLRGLRGVDGPAWTLPEERWSLAGQQAKLALARINGRWFEAHGSAATTHILKPGIGRLLHQGLVEHVTMRAAAAAGVDVAGTWYRWFEDQPAIVVERYDRAVLGDGSVLRFHQEDFCSASGRSPEQKYESPRGAGLRDLARIARTHSTDVSAAMQALGDFVAVNYVAGAPDGHSKNISILLTPGETVVAPLYDLATGLVYDGGQVHRQVAVSIGGVRDFGSVNARHWDKAATVLGLPPAQYRERVRHLAEHFPDALSAELDRIGTSEASDVKARAMDAMARHAHHVIASL